MMQTGGSHDRDRLLGGGRDGVGLVAERPSDQPSAAAAEVGAPAAPFVGVYLLHFAQPVKHAGHYLGLSDGTKRSATIPRFVRDRQAMRVREWAAVDAAGAREVYERLRGVGSRCRLCPQCRTRDRA